MLKVRVKPPVKRRYVLGFATEPAAVQPGERERLKRLFLFLCKRRFLGSEWGTIDRNALIASVGQLRRELRSVVHSLPPSSGSLAHIGAMRAACRQFGDNVEGDDKRPALQGQDFFGAVGALRALLGLQIVLLAERFELDIDPYLDGILPPVEE